MMILIVIMETGEELEYCKIEVPTDWDADMIDVLQNKKEERAMQEYPEARGFYWEDRRNWNHRIAMAMREMFP